MTRAHHEPGRAPWATIVGFAALLAITNGCRQSLGLFVRPLAATGAGIASVSLVLAVGQLCWGACQPAFGILGDRIGNFRVLLLGALLLAGGLALAPWTTSPAGLMVTLGLLSAIGAGAGSFAILIGAASRQVGPAHMQIASAIVTAGASIGQFIFAPLTQSIMARAGWPIAMWTLSGAALLTIGLAYATTGRGATDEAARLAPRIPLADLLRPALAERGYWCLHLGFFTCGFHIAFLVTHLPGEVALCGLPAASAGIALAVIGVANIAGTLLFGRLARHQPLKGLLIAVYLTRVVAISLYLLAPKNVTTLYAFSAVLGFTWLVTMPLTAGIVGKLFGARHLSTLFGFVVLSHQIGGFFGAWVGGLVVARTGNYTPVWIADLLLAAVAALAHVPIREPMTARPVPAPA